MSYKKKMTVEEKEVADKVADEILTVKEEDNRLFFVLVLLFLTSLIFLVSSVSFAVFDTYYNGGKKDVINVGADIVVDDTAKNKNKDQEKDVDQDNKDQTDKGQTVDNKSTTDKTTTTTRKRRTTTTTKKPVKPEDIDDGIVTFNFIEKSNYINMVNVFPTEDNVGKHLTGDRETFDFNISVAMENVSHNVAYEISIVPIAGNTINPNDLRVYLTEDGNEVSVTGRDVNTYGHLPNSTRRRGAKLLYKKVVPSDVNYNYVFKMWYDHNAPIFKESKKFSCKIAVDAYYE